MLPLREILAERSYERIVIGDLPVNRVSVISLDDLRITQTSGRTSTRGDQVY